MIHSFPELRPSGQALRIPAKVLAHFAHAAVFADESDHVVQMAEHDRLPFLTGRMGGNNAGLKIPPCFAEYPGIPLDRPADHDAVAAGFVQHSSDIPGAADVPVPDHRN